MARPGSTKAAVLEYIEKNGSATGPELAEYLGISRQAVSLHLRRLIADGAIFKTGKTRAAQYFPIGAATPPRKFKRELTLTGLDESVVYNDAMIALSLSQLPKNVESIVHYAFTEVLNNAIDHSMSDKCRIELRVDAINVFFTIRDYGIGVFQSIADKLNLPDEQTALVELIKGKTTTQPQAHSGEGLFFVSRSADQFLLRSHRLQIEWDKFRDDVFVSDQRFIEGTHAQFEIRNDSLRRLENVFDEFAPKKYDFQFQKTIVLVKLLQREYVSRSEAKRLLHNLDKFSEIELDMRGVVSVGQGFADEIFRVFAAAHPGIELRTKNASSSVNAMIRHVKKGIS